MKTMLDIRNVLKRYGSFIYTGSLLGDIELMEQEIRQLYNVNIISKDIYVNALLVLNKEKNIIQKK